MEGGVGGGNWRGEVGYVEENESAAFGGKGLVRFLSGGGEEMGLAVGATEQKTIREL